MDGWMAIEWISRWLSGLVDRLMAIEWISR